MTVASVMKPAAVTLRESDTVIRAVQGCTVTQGLGRFGGARAPIAFMWVNRKPGTGM